MKKIIIAIDGHSSTGKSTLAKQLAHKLGYKYVDSGAMYRAVTHFALGQGCMDKDILNESLLISLLPNVIIDFSQSGSNNGKMLLNGKELGQEIRSMEVSQWVSAVAKIPEVREKLVELQKKIGLNKGVVMDGRDIGTVVFPEAELKIFMTASSEIRAKRRYEELKEKETTLSFEEVLMNVEKRDQIDTSRELSPLRKAEDAMVLDNSNLSQKEQLETVMKWVMDRLRIEKSSSNIKNWLDAARLRTLPLSVSGIIIAAGLALSERAFDYIIFILSLLCTLGFQILSNFANDYGDGIKGTDNEDRVGPMRAIQSGRINRRQMKNAIGGTAAVTFIFSLILIIYSFGWSQSIYILLFTALGIAAITAAVKYTVGRNAYGYYGWGDFFVLLFFGFLSVLGGRFLYMQQWDWWSVLPAFAVGLLSVGVLNLNNMRDYVNDARVGKKTLVVLIGKNNAKGYHLLLILSSVMTLILYSLALAISWKNWIYLIAFIPLIKHLITVLNNQDPKTLDPELKKLALTTVLISVLFSVGNML